MASVASQLIEEVTAHEQSDSLEDARVIYADGTYFQNNLRKITTRWLSKIRKWILDIYSCGADVYVIDVERDFK